MKDSLDSGSTKLDTYLQMHSTATGPTTMANKEPKQYEFEMDESTKENIIDDTNEKIDDSEIGGRISIQTHNHDSSMQKRSVVTKPPKKELQASM